MDHWKPEDRQIYRYFNGTGVIAADPLPLQLALSEYEGLDVEFRLMGGGELTPAKEKATATRNVVTLARKVFRVEPFQEAADGKTAGLTDGECLQLLYHFMEWTGTQKKTPNGSPTSAATTEPAPSAAP